MAGKRTASNYLTDQNWDQEEEPEEAGKFEVAGKDILQKRKIKVAKRRNLNSDDGGKGSQVFKGFSFGAGTLGSGSAPTISLGNFGTKSSKDDGASTPCADTRTKSPASAKSSDNGGQDNSTSGANVKYLSSLKALNQGFRNWICDHLDKNFLIDLTPVCNDYIKHMKEIEKKSKSSETEVLSTATEDNEVTFKAQTTMTETTKSSAGVPLFSFTSSNTASSTATFTVGKTDTEKNGAADLPKIIFGSSTAAPFSFSAKPKEETAKPSFTFGASTAPSFSFGAEKTKEPIKPAFGFSAVPQALLEMVQASAAPVVPEAAASGGADDAEYVPPVADHKTVEEADAIFTQRCKLFYQKDGKWLDKGIGNLHLKPSNGKTQLLMRADTSLGNILLNIMLQPVMNFKPQGKNSVSFVCMPNPPLESAATEESPKPTMMLLKVKTEEMANTLREKLDEHKG